MELGYNQPEPAKGARAAVGRVRTRVRTGLSNAIGHVPGIAVSARKRVGHAAEGLPEAMNRAESGARSTVTGLQTMSDSRLRLLAAASIGFGTGLRLAGASRLATVAAFVPACFSPEQGRPEGAPDAVLTRALLQSSPALARVRRQIKSDASSRLASVHVRPHHRTWPRRLMSPRNDLFTLRPAAAGLAARPFAAWGH
jgi:hypothetical protein